MFKKDAIEKLVRNFSDNEVGCVCGEQAFINTEESSVGGGEGLYWKYELFLKRKEAEIRSVAFTKGDIYAIRKELFDPVDPALADDFVVPLTIAAKGFRVVQEPEAISYEKVSTTARDEFKRKVRIVARDSRAYLKFKGMFHPLKSWLAFQLLSHKLLRWLVPVFLMGIFASNCFLLNHPLYQLALLLQVMFYLSACVGLLFQKTGIKSKIFYIPFYFCMVNTGALVGLWRNLSGKQTAIWEKAETTR